ncbi:PA14 domain-containing protein [Planctomycetota bacterium]|nr:PA14 domain-containing protein [Planctomycetota bacterium]
MNRTILLFAAPVMLLLLFAAAWVLLLPADTETDTLIGQTDPQTEADSADPSISLPDGDVADTGSGSDRGASATGDATGKGATKPDGSVEAEGESSGHSGVDPEIEAASGGIDSEESGLTKTNKADDDAAETSEKPPEAAPGAKREHPLKKNGRPKHQNVGNRKPRAHSLKKAAGVKALDDAPEKLKQDRRGLFAKYYRFYENPISALMNPNQEDLDTRTPDLVRIDRQVHFPNKSAWDDLPFDKSNMMAVWTGFFVIEKAADYWLFLGCDLSGRVELDGQTVLLNEGRDYTEVSTVLTLEPGLHPLRIEYVEAKNGSPVEELGSCNFMWVPEGSSKPVAVPAEMLLLPQELWSDDAPIITRLSRDSGAVGDEITIYGQGFTETGKEPNAKNTLVETTVVVGGQAAVLSDSSATKLVVKIPIGARSGAVVVLKRLKVSGIVHQRPPQDAKPGEIVIGILSDRTIPSNSIDFTVTNQFGLIAEWHNLEGWSHVDFMEPGVREAEVTQLENPPTFETREDLNLEFKQNPMACTWTGKLGIPANWHIEFPQFPIQFLLRFESKGRLRVKLGENTRASAAMNGETDNQTALDFELTIGEEKYLPLQIDWVNEGGPASLKVTLLSRRSVLENDIGGVSGARWVFMDDIPAYLFFPPVVPPTPPQIVLVEPQFQEGEEPAALPYTATSNLPSVREGQECLIEVKVNAGAFTEDEIKSAVIAIDGQRALVTYRGIGEIDGEGAGHQYSFIMPTGLDEGRMYARIGSVTSPPFLIDVQNKGLIAYYYDLPNGGGYRSMPDLEPMACFAIRKDPWVNYDNANAFDLPFPAETFAVQWFGAIIIETDGFYTFTTRSDDGVIVWIDGNVAVSDNDLHYQREKSGEPIFLAAGTYTFKMEFFENNIHEVCELMWECKDGENATLIEKQTVPKRAFTWDQHPALPSKTATGKRTDGSDPE